MIFCRPDPESGWSVFGENLKWGRHDDPFRPKKADEPKCPPPPSGRREQERVLEAEKTTMSVAACDLSSTYYTSLPLSVVVFSFLVHGFSKIVIITFPR